VVTPLERDAPTCLYSATAPPAPATRPLAADLRIEVAVVGAGFTGLSAALHLAERGRRVVLLEAREAGWGAAGRNGGQVNAGLKHEPDEVERDFGPLYGPRLVGMASAAPEYLFALIARYGIECESRRGGTLRAARSPRLVATLKSSVDQWAARGQALELWDSARVARATGTDRYAAATFDPRGGAVNPLALARGLAVAALRAGATMHTETPALRLAADGSGWRIDTPRASVRAERVVLATDGYTDALWPGLRTSIVPIYSSIIATEPLPATLATELLPNDLVVYETGYITLYYRRDGTGRLLVGGRGRQRDSARRSDYEHLVREALRLWPSLASVEWTHWWNGQFALTPDFYPRFHLPAPNLYVGLGYSGRGVAFGTAMGAQLAAAAAGEPPESLALPATPIPHLPFHGFWRVGVAAGVAYGRVLDRLGR